MPTKLTKPFLILSVFLLALALFGGNLFLSCGDTDSQANRTVKTAPLFDATEGCTSFTYYKYLDEFLLLTNKGIQKIPENVIEKTNSYYRFGYNEKQQLKSISYIQDHIPRIHYICKYEDANKTRSYSMVNRTGRQLEMDIASMDINNLYTIQCTLDDALRNQTCTFLSKAQKRLLPNGVASLHFAYDQHGNCTQISCKNSADTWILGTNPLIYMKFSYNTTNQLIAGYGFKTPPEPMDNTSNQTESNEENQDAQTLPASNEEDTKNEAETKDAPEHPTDDQEPVDADTLEQKTLHEYEKMMQNSIEHTSDFGFELTYNNENQLLQAIQIKGDYPSFPEQLFKSIELTYDSNMNCVEKIYPEHKDNAKQIYKTKLSVNDKGLITELRFYNKDDMLVSAENTNIFPIQQLEYNEQGFVERTILKNRYESIKRIKIQQYDKNGFNILEKTLKREAGDWKNASSIDWYFQKTFDAMGNIITLRSYDHYNNLINLYYGAIIQNTYNENNQLIQKAYFDSQNQPYTIDSGYALIKVEYNDDGLTTKESYFGMDNQPVRNYLGIHSIQFAYTEFENISEISYLDTTGKHTNSYDGYAKQSNSYNELGLLTEERYVLEDGSPVTSRPAKITYAYNNLGLRIEKAFFDASDKRMEYDGAARIEYVYDDNHQLEKEVKFNAADEPIPDKTDEEA